MELAPMRSILAAIFMMVLAVPAFAQPGSEAERVTRASSVDAGYGAVVISIRSELYLDDPLQIYFLREGGSIENDADVIRFQRKQGFFAFGNDTVEYQIRAYQLLPGTYRLVAHGMNCPKIPQEDERCLIEVNELGVKEEMSRPSRGYSEIAPTFEVVAGSVTYAGDFGLTARNTVEWAEVPHDELKRINRRFGTMPRAPEPVIPGEFRMKYGLTPRSFDDDYGRRF